MVVSPSDASEVLPNIGEDGFRTIVIDPDEYLFEDLRAISGDVLFWFMRRVIPPSETRFPDAPLLADWSAERLNSRREFLDELIASSNLTRVVFSDRDSRDFFVQQGGLGYLSPPPIDLSAIRDQAGRMIRGCILSATAEGVYSETFRSRIPEGYLRTSKNDGEGWVDEFFLASHFANLGESIFPGFTYEVALSLASGITLITTALEPLWGFEPGVDFIEISNPEEFFRVCEAIVRNPASTQLMALRAGQKAHIFDSEKVIQKLL